MFTLTAENAVEYLRSHNRVSGREILVNSLSGGVANAVLKIFDTAAGPRLGTDMRSPAKIARGVPDTRMTAGTCMVIKQPLPKFNTAAEWLVDIDRVWIERDCMRLLAGILPAGSVPEVLWSDEENYVLAISCAPSDAVIWKNELLAGRLSTKAAESAGLLAGMMHATTLRDAAVQQRFGDPKGFVQQRIDPYLLFTAEKHPDRADVLRRLSDTLLNAKLCLIHGDYSPKNMFLVPDPAADTARGVIANFDHLLLLDFEVAFFGHPAFDVATLMNHLLLKGFYHGAKWRPFMLAADRFWQAYRQTVPKELAAATESIGGTMLGALLLARVDGKSPAEYLTEETVRERVRAAGRELLASAETGLDAALDAVADHMA